MKHNCLVSWGRIQNEDYYRALRSLIIGHFLCAIIGHFSKIFKFHDKRAPEGWYGPGQDRAGMRQDRADMSQEWSGVG